MSKSQTAQWASRGGWASLLFSALLWLFTTICFLGAWDQVAAVTTFPQWSWAFAGVLSAMLAGWLMRPVTRPALAALLLWLLTTLYFADNLIPVLRGIAWGTKPANTIPANTLRVASLNCASRPEAAAEVMKFRPDILLLQESPVSNKLAQLAREWFGERASFLIGFDCAIVSRYPLRPVEERSPTHYTRAILSLATNRDLLVTSLRLTPPLGRTDLWNPEAWHAYLEDTRFRRRQLQSVIEASSSKAGSVEIIGGDFNAPVGDGIFRILRGYRDSHRTAGRRWGNTALNTIPFFRPDQIWTKGLSPMASFAFKTEHSDHRMVIADLWLDQR